LSYPSCHSSSTTWTLILPQVLRLKIKTQLQQPTATTNSNNNNHNNNQQTTNNKQQPTTNNNNNNNNNKKKKKKKNNNAYTSILSGTSFVTCNSTLFKLPWHHVSHVPIQLSLIVPRYT